MFFHIDESGHPHPKDGATRPVLAAIGVPISRLNDLGRQIFALRGAILGQGETDPWLEEKYKAQAILNERTYSREKTKWEYAEGIFEIAASFPVVTLAVVMERPAAPLPEPPPYRLPYHWWSLLQRIDRYVRSEAPGRQAVLVMDSQHSKAETRLSIRFSNISGLLLRLSHESALPGIVASPFFADSKVAPGIQVADHAASCLRQFYELRDAGPGAGDPYRQAVQRLHGLVQRTVYDHQDQSGQKWPGEYEIPLSRMGAMWPEPDSAASAAPVTGNDEAPGPAAS